MIYVATIDVPDHSKWGSVIQAELVLPSQVRHVRSFWSSVTLPKTSVLASLIAEQTGSLSQDVVCDCSVQIGSLSATVNNTHVVADGTPLCVLSHGKRSTLNRVRTTLPHGGIEILNGSTLRIVIEEKLFEPFEHDTERLTIAPFNGALDYLHPLPDGSPSNVSTNAYTAKFYMEYDK